MAIRVARALTVSVAISIALVTACSQTVETTFEDFVTHQTPLNDQLLGELSDGSASETYDWSLIAEAEVEWLSAHPPAPCYATVHGLWLGAMRELAEGGDPSTGDAVLRYILDAQDAYAAADASCPRPDG